MNSAASVLPLFERNRATKMNYVIDFHQLLSPELVYIEDLGW